MFFRFEWNHKTWRNWTKQSALSAQLLFAATSTRISSSKSVLIYCALHLNRSARLLRKKQCFISTIVDSMLKRQTCWYLQLYEFKLGLSLYLFWCVLDKGKKKASEFCFVFLLAKFFWFIFLKYIYANNLLILYFNCRFIWLHFCI